MWNKLHFLHHYRKLVQIRQNKGAADTKSTNVQLGTTLRLEDYSICVCLTLWPKLGKENRYLYQAHILNNPPFSLVGSYLEIGSSVHVTKDQVIQTIGLFSSGDQVGFADFYKIRFTNHFLKDQESILTLKQIIQNYLLFQ